MFIQPSLPFSQEPIFIEWQRADIGGFRVAAWTDKSGNPYLGIFNINRIGKPKGLPCWYRRRRFLSDIVIGFDHNELPVWVSVDAEVTDRGLQVCLGLPWEPFTIDLYNRKLSARWGSEAPTFGFVSNPSNDDAKANYVLSEMV